MKHIRSECIAINRAFDFRTLHCPSNNFRTRQCLDKGSRSICASWCLDMIPTMCEWCCIVCYLMQLKKKKFISLNLYSNELRCICWLDILPKGIESASMRSIPGLSKLGPWKTLPSWHLPFHHPAYTWLKGWKKVSLSF